MKDEAKDQLSTCGWIRIKLSSKASSINGSFLRSFRSLECFGSPNIRLLFQSGPRVVKMFNITVAFQHLRCIFYQITPLNDLFLDPCMLVLCIFVSFFHLLQADRLAHSLMLATLFFFLFSLFSSHGNSPNLFPDLGDLGEEGAKQLLPLPDSSDLPPPRRRLLNSASLLRGRNTSTHLAQPNVVYSWLKTRRLQQSLFWQHSSFHTASFLLW